MVNLNSIKSPILKSLLLLCTLSTVLLFTNCNPSADKGKSPMENNLPILVVNPETENPDFYLRIIDINENDSAFVCTLKSLNQADTVGLLLEVKKWMEPGLNEDGTSNEETGFSQGKMLFKSLGHISDQLVAAIGQQYKMTTDSGMKTDTIAPLVFSSNKERVSFENHKLYSFKLFLKNDIGEEAEVFAIIDLHRRLFEFRAKDKSYFSRILNSLQQ